MYNHTLFVLHILTYYDFLRILLFLVIKEVGVSNICLFEYYIYIYIYIYIYTYTYTYTGIYIYIPVYSAYRYICFILSFETVFVLFCFLR